MHSLWAAPAEEGRGPFIPAYVGAAWSPLSQQPQAPRGAVSPVCWDALPETLSQDHFPVGEPAHFLSDNYESRPPFSFFPSFPSSRPPPPSILPTSCWQSALWVVSGHTSDLELSPCSSGADGDQPGARRPRPSLGQCRPMVTAGLLGPGCSTGRGAVGLAFHPVLRSCPSLVSASPAARKILLSPRCS